MSSTFPKDKATDVPFNTKINALFSEAMDPTTLTTITFTVKKGSTSVPGTVTYTGFTATFAPTNNLAASTLFTATITTGAKDLAGNPLASNYVWSWTTAAIPDTTPPRVIVTFPDRDAMDVPFNLKITATFSEAMDPTSITTVTFTLKKGSTLITGTVTYTGVTATFTPLSDLEALTVYTATITTGVKDLAGNPMASDYVWSFTTDSLPDTTPPTVSSTDPVDLETDVPINKIISASFSEAMDPTTITTVTFILENGSTLVAGSVNYAGSIATLTPAADLLASTFYTATITTGVKDLAGNPMASNYVWSFTSGTNVVAINPVLLGHSSNFAVLAGYAITTVPASDITGDVGLSPAAESFITGFSQTKYTGYSLSPQVTGFIYAADMASPTPANLTLAKGDLTIAYNDAAGRTPVPTGPFLNPGAGNLAGLNLVPGLYKFTGSAIATTSFTLTGNANDVWIFQIGSNLNISTGVQVTLAGGAKSTNVFWQVGTEATLETTSSFKGTIMAEASITMKTGAILDGRLMAFSGTVAMDQNFITIPIP